MPRKVDPMDQHVFNSLDEVIVASLRETLEAGTDVRPRGQRTLEILNYRFCLHDPRSRLVLNPTRGWSAPLAIGEFCWHSAGSSDAASIGYYANGWLRSSDDGSTILESCYGAKIFAEGNEDNQWSNLKAMLTDDPESRRACLTLARPLRRSDSTSADLACTTSCQFLVRSGKLHCFVSMRSNDAIWGLPYDVFFFTMLQERLAFELGYDLGAYNHQATSFHLYERHFDLARSIVDAGWSGSRPMQPMEDPAGLQGLLIREKNIRNEQGSATEGKLKGYWGQLETILLAYARKDRAVRDPVWVGKILGGGG